MTDVYKIGVSIVLANGMSPVLGVIAKDLLGIKTKMSDVEGGAGRWRTAVAGVAAIMGAAGILGIYGELVKKGSELVHQQELMNVAGASGADVARATAAAWRLSAQYKNVSAIDILKIIADTRLPYGSTDLAIQNAGSAVALTSIMRSSLPAGDADKASEDMFSVVRSGEMRNISLDPAKMTKYFDDVAKVQEAFKGKVSAKDFFQFDKYARTNTPYLSERFLTKIAPSLMLEMGSSSSATALTSLSQEVISGKMNKRSAEEMIKLGLIDPASVLHTTSLSTQLKPGSVKGWQQAVTDPDLWVQNVLMPAMTKHGVTGDMAQRLTFGVVFGNRTAENISNVLGKPDSVRRLNKDAGMIDQAAGLAETAELAKRDPTTAMQGFTTSWNNLMVALGSPQVQTATTLLNNLSSGIDKLAGLAGRHPTAVKWMGEIALALAAVLAVVGVVAVGTAAIGALAAGGAVAIWVAVVGAISAAVGVLLALNWNAVGKFFTDLAKKIGEFFNFLIHGDGKKKSFSDIMNDPNTVRNDLENPRFPTWYPFGQPKPPNVPPPQPHKAPASFVMTVDGRTLGQVAAKYMATEANSPLSGFNGFDGSQHMTPVALGAA